MFLNRLNTEEKIAFLELAHHVARSDDDFSNEQKEIISTYCLEMQINDIAFQEELFNLRDTLAKIKNKMSQKVVLIELMALIYSDNFVHGKELEIIDTMHDIFDVTEVMSSLYAEWTKSILALTRQGQLLLEL